MPAGPTITCWPSTTLGLRKALEQSVVDHRLGALRGFLRRLEYRHDRALPCVARLREQLRRAGEPRRVHVVAARVHHRHGVAFAIGRGDLARIGQTGRFLDRQRIHVRAQHHDRTVAVAQQSHDARLADARGDVVARVAQPLCSDARGARLLHRELGMRVNVLVELLEIRQQRVESGNGATVRCIDRWCRHA